MEGSRVMTYSLTQAERLQRQTNLLIEHVTFTRDTVTDRPMKTVLRKAGVKLELALNAIDQAVDVLKELDR
jgi:hypothetical protein